MLDVGCPSGFHAGRLDDQPALVAILTQLEQSDNYAALMRTEVELAGQRRLIGDLARSLREVFDSDRQTFVNAMRLRCRTYVDRYGREATIRFGGEAFCREAIGLADTLFELTTNLGCTATRNALADRTVLGCGYGVARACMYVGNVGVGQEFAIDGNDYEDYLISLHLGVSNDRIFVTNDGSVRVALRRAISAFEDYFAAQGGQFSGTASIIAPADFIAQYR
jgi:hypothetical protein